MKQVLTQKGIFKVEISRHGEERLRERTPYTSKQLEEHVTKVWNFGNVLADYKDKTNTYKYLKNVVSVGGEDRSIRVKGNTLYIFNLTGTVFITCYDIPQKVIQSDKNKKQNSKRGRE